MKVRTVVYTPLYEVLCRTCKENLVSVDIIYIAVISAAIVATLI